MQAHVHRDSEDTLHIRMVPTKLAAREVARSQSQPARSMTFQCPPWVAVGLTLETTVTKYSYGGNLTLINWFWYQRFVFYISTTQHHSSLRNCAIEPLQWPWMNAIMESAHFFVLLILNYMQLQPF